MTVGETVTAYRALRDLNPSALGEEMTNEVMDVVSDLEPAVRRFDRKVEAHRDRLTEGDETDEDALEEAINSLMGEEAEVEASLDLSKTPSIGVRYDLKNIDALQPLL